MGKRERAEARAASLQEVINLVNWHFDNSMAMKLRGEVVIRMFFSEGGYTHALDEIKRTNPMTVIRRDDQLRTVGVGGE